MTREAGLIVNLLAHWLKKLVSHWPIKTILIVLHSETLYNQYDLK